MDKMNGMGMDLTKDNIEKLKELFPSVVTDGKIDFEMLKNIMGEEIDSSKEKYAFTWRGKSNSIKMAQAPSSSTLRPQKDKSYEWEKTQNLYIEGDNLEVLKQLQKTYFGRVKLIYIDPPYNTGTDFVYKDDFKNSVKNYKEQTNQISQSNSETSGRYHSDWLNLMYSRLILARNLLSEDGAIFVSIDYNEVANLKKIMDEVFGEDNFQREIIWRIGWLSGYKTAAPNFVRNHDTILFYSKNSSSLEFIKKYIENKDFKPLVKQEKNITEKMNQLGLSKDSQRELLHFINHENRPEKYPIEDTWNCNEYDDLNSIAIVSFSGEKISKLLDVDYEFKGQKSIKMLMRIIEALTNDDDIIMDFFSGSGSTAHAVIQLNYEKNSNRKFIMVQLPELIEEDSNAYSLGYRTLCDIGEERIRVVGNRIKNEWNQRKNEKGLLTKSSEYELDTGFKVFSLDSTNINPWDNMGEYNEKTLFNIATIFKSDRSKEDVLYEIMLKYGIFDQPVSEIEINGKMMYRVGQNHMIACLEEVIDDNDITEICKIKPEKVVFKEDGFKDDNAKINAEYNLKKSGIEDVKCI